MVHLIQYQETVGVPQALSVALELLAGAQVRLEVRAPTEAPCNKCASSLAKNEY